MLSVQKIVCILLTEAWCTRALIVSAPRSNPCHACARPCSLRAPPHSHTLAPVSISALRSKATHVRVRQRLSPEARCQVAASCRQWQGRTGACRAPLRAVSRSVGASSLRRDVAEGRCTRERERERWSVLKARDATNKEGGRERGEWHLVTDDDDVY